MLQNAYLLAKIGADKAENEQHFAENLPKIGNYPTGPTAGHLSIGAVLLAAGSTSLGTKRYQISVHDLFLLLLIKTRSEKN